MDERETMALLVCDRTATLARIATSSADIANIIAAATDSNIDDEHDPEGATVAFERAQLANTLATARAHLGDIEHAMERLAIHEYGRCESCGSAIGDERLQALPATKLCVRCSARQRK
jgi:DnaK suppressor protein